MSDDAIVFSETTEFQIPERTLTQAEWRAIVDSDPVLQFIVSVNEAAPKHPEWNTHYAGAHLKTFSEHATRYMVDKIGEPFCITAE